MNDVTDFVSTVYEMADYVDTSQYSVEVHHQEMTVVILDNFEDKHIVLSGEDASEYILQAEEMHQKTNQQVEFDTCLLANAKGYIE